MRPFAPFLLAALAWLPATAQDYLEPEFRLNGMETVKAFEAARAVLRSSTLTLHEDGGRDPVAMATLVAPGRAVAKASDLEGRGALSARDERRRPHAVAVERVDKASDLAILKVDWPDGKPVEWAGAPPPLGTWVAASTPRIGMLRVGLVSAKARPIDNRGATLGVSIVEEPKVKGARLAAVIPGGAAEKGGLKKDDIVVKAGDKTIAKRDDLVEFLKAAEPGTVIPFTVRRGKKSETIEITLDSPSDVLDRMNRNQQMSGETSRRKDPFPMIEQTDIPLPPSAMGGPLLDLEGRAVGVLIARADRVTTYALPAATVREVLDAAP
jgi:serine protease Do